MSNLTGLTAFRGLQLGDNNLGLKCLNLKGWDVFHLTSNASNVI
jgi:hypothetical protein